MNTLPREQVAAEVRVATARTGVTQAELASRIGMHPSTLSHRLNLRSAFDTDELSAIARALDTTPLALLGGAA